MNESAKEIINEYGYETWSDQQELTEFKISDKTVERKYDASIMVSKQDRLAKDVAAYDELLQRARLVRKPPFRLVVD